MNLHESLRTLTDREAAALLPDYFNGHLSDENRRLIEDWKSADKDNLEKYNAVLDLMMDYRALDTVSVLDVEAALRKVNTRIGKKRRSWIRYAERAAAILFIPLLAAAILTITRIGSNNPVYYQLTAETGMTGRVMLPDSTVVVLNSGSTLLFPSDFADDSRNVELIGEAYFDVRKDPERQFRVKLPDGSAVKVYGTRFNVNAYPDDNSVVTLVNGAIGYDYVNKKGDSNEIRLMPDQQITRTVKGDVSIVNIEASSAIAWKNNKIVLNSTPLNNILKTLERRFDVRFRITNHDIENVTLSGGAISIKNLDYVLETLNIATGMNWRYVGSPEDEDRIIEIS